MLKRWQQNWLTTQSDATSSHLLMKSTDDSPARAAGNVPRVE
jgi:hypothetical protein